MKHEILMDLSNKEAKPKEGMHPFSHVWKEKKDVFTDGAAAPSSVGIRCGGYFRFRGGDSAEQALTALRYGLETACFRLTAPTDAADPSLFAERAAELLAEINRALEDADSPFRFEELEFTQMDWCVQPQNSGAGRYSGFIIGQTGTRQVTVHSPLGIEGEWQCVCGVYNAPRKRKCAECKIPRPRWKA